MSPIDELAAVRRLLDVPGPRDEVRVAGRARLDELLRRENAGARTRREVASGRSRRMGLRAVAACGVAAVAAIAATVVAAHPGTSAHPGGSRAGASPAGSPRTDGRPVTAGSADQAILTAIDSVGDDVLYIKVTSSGAPGGVGDGVEQYWLWPASPARGQRVHLLVAGPGVQTSYMYTEPADGASVLPSRISANAETISSATKTWSAGDRPVPAIPYETSHYLLDKDLMLKDLGQHGELINGRATLGGRPAIEYSELGANGVLRLLFWFDAQTYLPLREEKLHWVSSPDSEQRYDFRFLPPTAANLAKLTPAVPAGYQRMPA